MQVATLDEFAHMKHEGPASVIAVGVVTVVAIGAKGQVVVWLVHSHCGEYPSREGKRLAMSAISAASVIWLLAKVLHSTLSHPLRARSHHKEAVEGAGGGRRRTQPKRAAVGQLSVTYFRTTRRRGGG